MHGTLLYPVPGRARLTRPKKFRDNPRIPKLPPDFCRRVATYMRTLVAELLHYAGAVFGEAGYGS